MPLVRVQLQVGACCLIDGGSLMLATRVHLALVEAVAVRLVETAPALTSVRAALRVCFGLDQARLSAYHAMELDHRRSSTQIVR